MKTPQVAFACLAALLSADALAETMPQEVEAWTSARDAARIDAKSKGPLGDFERKLARALIVPKASVGTLSGESPSSLSMTAAIGYESDGPALDTLLGQFAREFPSTKVNVCLTAGDTVRSVKVSRTGAEWLAAGLGMPQGAADVIPTLEATIGGQVVAITRTNAGDALYERILKRGSSTKPIVISLWPPVEEVPVRLSLTTVDGRKLTLPAELDGDATKLKLAPKAAWILPSGTSIPVDLARPVHKLLLAELVKSGTTGFERLSVGALHPAWTRERTTPQKWEAHVVGAESRWFSRTDFTTSASVSIQRSVDGCDLSLRFEPDLEKLVLSPMPLSAWKGVTGILVTDPSQKEVALGFLRGPAPESHAGSLTWAEFDFSLSRPQRCSKLCADGEAAAAASHQTAMADYLSARSAAIAEGKDVSKMVAPVRQSFDAQKCAIACRASRPFMECLTDAGRNFAAYGLCLSRSPRN
ncbi:MAG: hypothetical protein RL199_250 [Pseudomonadota bacterium]|jgi:hypothetical protein